MTRVAFFVDGFNVYHALDGVPQYRKYKWLDYAKLPNCYITQKDKVVKVTLFTAYVPWDTAKRRRHQKYVRVLQTRGVDIVFGSFRQREKKCRSCGNVYDTYEEKQTDVNIAISLLQLAHMDVYDKAIIVTGDSDVVPAVQAVQKTFPAKKIGIVIPIRRRAESLKDTADFVFKMKEKHLTSCQLDENIQLENGQVISRPPRWK